ncbi:MAG: alpha-amylase family glycosyl hydrolase [Pseudomonadales bacterium]|nr:alpha-amylase family glycosyl hydrolase [Pseudomonadales bacterium]
MQQELEKELERRILEHLAVIYPEQANAPLAKELQAEISMGRNAQRPLPHHNNWDERDTILITYGNTVLRDNTLPLHSLHEFLNKHLKDCIETVHILPFFPFSSDDGFAVMDYLSVNPALGDWEDIEAISKDYKLMADLVINHMSSRSLWFDNFKKQVDPGKDYFVEANPTLDYSAVVRPRNSSLLSEVATADGTKHIWCTFSEDQVDLNFKNPRVLVEFVRIIREYLNHGVTLFRMDAVPFLWKEAGTSCIHLQQTHEIIKLLRTLIEHHSPEAVIICENNVPNRENLTYFGNANEAHVIYNFSLPPLLVFTLLSGNCRHLKTWMMSMPPAQSGTTYLNFIASHDGIGLRPLDGLLSDQERNSLVQAAVDFGGRVTLRRAREGYDKPYELNIALFDLLKGTLHGGEDSFAFDRFICAHAIMLGLEGIPAFYIQSLFASRNDHKRLEHTGRNRSINRHIWDHQELESAINDATGMHGRVFAELKRLIKIRRRQPAFHPNATQFTLHLGTEVFAFWRQSINRNQSIFCLSNVTNKPQTINLSDINLITTDEWRDLISEENYQDLAQQLTLRPYQTVWISNLESDNDV